MTARKKARVGHKVARKSTLVLPTEPQAAATLASTLPDTYPRPCVYIFGDGGCTLAKDPVTGKTQSTGPGGWGTLILLLEPDEEPLAVMLRGGDPDTTNNRMEMSAVIRGLDVINDLEDLLTGDVPVHVVSDSQYVVKGITEWLGGWLRRGWEDVKNVEYWKQLLIARGELDVIFHHCRGHRDPNHFPAKSWDRFTALGNEYVDLLATMGRDDMLAGKRRQTTA